MPFVFHRDRTAVFCRPARGATKRALFHKTVRPCEASLTCTGSTQRTIDSLVIDTTPAKTYSSIRSPSSLCVDRSLGAVANSTSSCGYLWTPDTCPMNNWRRSFRREPKQNMKYSEIWGASSEIPTKTCLSETPTENKPRTDRNTTKHTCPPAPKKVNALPSTRSEHLLYCTQMTALVPSWPQWSVTATSTTDKNKNGDNNKSSCSPTVRQSLNANQVLPRDHHETQMPLLARRLYV